MDLKKIGRELNDFHFSVQIPSTGEFIKGRPYTIRDEFKLAQIQKANTKKHVFQLILEVVKEKYYDLTTKQIEALTALDVQYLMSQLKVQSEDVSVPLIITCINPACKHEFKHALDISKIVISNEGSFKENVEIVSKSKMKNKLTITLKTIPYLELIGNYSNDSIDDVDENMSDAQMKNMLINSIGMVAYGDEVKTEFDRDELLEFIEDIPRQNFPQIKKFLANPPKLIYPNPIECPLCKTTNELDVNDFFFSFF